MNTKLVPNATCLHTSFTLGCATCTAWGRATLSMEDFEVETTTALIARTCLSPLFAIREWVRAALAAKPDATAMEIEFAINSAKPTSPSRDYADSHDILAHVRATFAKS